jgi:hypothetical protein
VTFLLLDHHCASSTPLVEAQVSRLDWPEQVVPTILKVEIKTTSQAIANVVKLHFEHTIATKRA